MTNEESAQIQREETEDRPLPSLRFFPDPVLTSPATPVEAVTDDVQQLARDLLRAVIHFGGAGLAAPQVGIPLRVIVVAATRKVDGREHFEPMCLVNPRILATSLETDVQEEGCLSLPGVRARVQRPVWVDVEVLLPDGKTVGRFMPPLSRVVQHELDHLDGVLIWDKVGRVQAEVLRKAYARKMRAVSRGARHIMVAGKAIEAPTFAR